MIFRLDERLLFPEPELAEPDGLLAVGGDLSPDRLILAYQNGIFPWYSDDTPILWYAPHERCVIFPNELKVSKSMRQVLRSGKLTVTVNTCFKKVITACATVGRKDQDGTWITDDMITAYLSLHQLGYAKSIEVWYDGELSGGLYGVQVGSVFCGESMFSLVSNASKVALTHLCGLGYDMIDCQMHTQHLQSMGARIISMGEYRRILQKGINE